ncbi:MAG: hypothetical protein LBI84_08110 [Propionibacteriaceae bacterium]|jgi:uncharacterized membrane protein YphA (DoxX/SURF4 family)|nr:hypothetical protein [Propionibacteriaceae bacterium]
MNLLRVAGRVLLAGPFVVRGVAAIRHPSQSSTAAEPLADCLNGLADRLLPPAANRFLPRSVLGWVRFHGAVEALGGAMVATGLGRRLGGLLLVGAQIPHVFAAARLRIDDEDSDGELPRQAALLGAVVIEALDTQGRPSARWRAAERRRGQVRRPSPAAKPGKAPRSEAKALG